MTVSFGYPDKTKKRHTNFLHPHNKTVAAHLQWTLISLTRTQTTRTGLLTLLSLVYVEVCILQQFADDRLDVFADITSLRQRRAVTDGKWDVETSRQDLGKERLPCRAIDSIYRRKMTLAQKMYLLYCETDHFTAILPWKRNKNTNKPCSKNLQRGFSFRDGNQTNIKVTWKNRPVKLKLNVAAVMTWRNRQQQAAPLIKKHQPFYGPFTRQCGQDGTRNNQKS